MATLAASTQRLAKPPPPRPPLPPTRVSRPARVRQRTGGIERATAPPDARTGHLQPGTTHNATSCSHWGDAVFVSVRVNVKVHRFSIPLDIGQGSARPRRAKGRDLLNARHLGEVSLAGGGGTLPLPLPFGTSPPIPSPSPSLCLLAVFSLSSRCLLAVFSRSSRGSFRGLFAVFCWLSGSHDTARSW